MKKDFAVICYGGQGAWHTRQILASDVAALTGVYDTDPAKNELAEKNGIHAYESREALLSDGRIDFVVVATPNDVHREIAIDAMAHGKHVISENLPRERNAALLFITVHIIMIIF